MSHWGLQKVVEEFRANYYAGQKRALDAYDLLNYYYEEDTKLKMGDFFLEEDSDVVSYENYVTLLLQASSSTLNSLETILASATDSGNNLWIDRLVSMGDNEDASFFERGMEDVNISASTFGSNNGNMVMDFLILALGLAGGIILGRASLRKKKEFI